MEALGSPLFNIQGNVELCTHKDHPLDAAAVQQALWPMVPASVSNVDLTILETQVPQELLDTHPDFANYNFVFYKIFVDAVPYANTAYVISGPVKGVSDSLQYRNWVKALESGNLDAPLEIAAPAYWITMEAEAGNHTDLDLWKKSYKDLTGFRVLALPKESLAIDAFFTGYYGAARDAIQPV